MVRSKISKIKVKNREISPILRSKLPNAVFVPRKQKARVGLAVGPDWTPDGELGNPRQPINSARGGRIAQFYHIFTTKGLHRLQD